MIKNTMTKTELFKTMHGREVIKTPINIMTNLDNEALKQSIIDSLEANGKTIADFEENETSYSVKGFSNFWMKSKLKQNEKGILRVRSKDYIFYGETSETHGDIPKKENLIILENGFISVKKWFSDGTYTGFKYTLVK